jgi:hypothetical protein
MPLRNIVAENLGRELQDLRVARRARHGSFGQFSRFVVVTQRLHAAGQVDLRERPAFDRRNQGHKPREIFVPDLHGFCSSYSLRRTCRTLSRKRRIPRHARAIRDTVPP